MDPLQRLLLGVSLMSKASADDDLEETEQPIEEALPSARGAPAIGALRKRLALSFIVRRE
jgi:hypothetical protein